MKTTFDLPDDLVLAAKKRALEMHRPLRALVEEALREALSRKPVPAKRKKIRWTTSSAPWPKDLDISSRAKMYEWFDKHRDDK